MEIKLVVVIVIVIYELKFDTMVIMGFAHLKRFQQAEKISLELFLGPNKIHSLPKKLKWIR